jgi:hypothetical protein
MVMEATALFLIAAQAASATVADFELPPIQSVPQAGYDVSAFEPIDPEIIYSEGYLTAHPDQRFRLLGNNARNSGRYQEALKYFRRAARYADKLSQGAIAEMYLNGEGIERDRALAYAWMDLAAERGSRFLLAHRERYWSELTPAERTRAIQVGEDLYAEYGDEVAKPRLERILVTTRRKVTGSRAGWVGNLSICISPPDCSVTVTGEQYYADRYWRPKKYWDWQDRIILTPRKEGGVDVGPLEVMQPKPETED